LKALKPSTARTALVPVRFLALLIAALIFSGCAANSGPGGPCGERREDLVNAMADRPEEEFDSARWAVRFYATQPDGSLGLVSDTQGIADFKGEKYRSEGIVNGNGETNELKPVWVVGDTGYRRIDQAWHPPFLKAPADPDAFPAYFLANPLIGKLSDRGDDFVGPDYRDDRAMRRRIVDALIIKIEAAPDQTLHGVRTRHCTVTLNGDRAKGVLPDEVYREMTSHGENFREEAVVDVWIDGEGRLIRLSTTSSDPTDDDDDIFKLERDFWDYDEAPPVKLPADLRDPAPTTTPGGPGVTSLSGTISSGGVDTPVSIGEDKPDVDFEGRGGDSGSVTLYVIRNPNDPDAARDFALTIRPAPGSAVSAGIYQFDDPEDGPKGVPGFTFGSTHLNCESDTRSGRLELTEVVLQDNGSPIRLAGTFSLSCDSKQLGKQPGTPRTFTGQIRYHSLG
jgi:hypothetical protein